MDLSLRLCRYVAFWTHINDFYRPGDTSPCIYDLVGYCLDDNNQCYLTCAETINNNPFGGCSPGWDCPWFPDAAAGHCRSEMHPTQQFDIYRTSGQCCDANFAGSSTCVQESKDSHPPFAWVRAYRSSGRLVSVRSAAAALTFPLLRTSFLLRF